MDKDFGGILNFQNLNTYDTEALLDLAVKTYLEYDYESAFQMFLNLASRGNGKAMYFIGKYYFYGIGNVVKSDTSMAVTWFRMGALQGDVLADIQGYYWVHESVKNPKAYFNRLFAPIKALADSGDVFAQYELAEWYDNCLFVNRDERDKQTVLEYSKKADEYCERAVIGGNPERFFAYELFSTDAPVTVSWVQKAAELGCGDAMAILGSFYYEGTEVEKNVAKGISWLKKAVEKGETNGLGSYTLAQAYMEGNGVEKDYKQAFKYLRTAAESGNLSALAALAFLDTGRHIITASEGEEALDKLSEACFIDYCIRLNSVKRENPDNE